MVNADDRAATTPGQAAHRGATPLHIAQQLRQSIGSGSIPAGVQLRQESLAGQFQVSRVPIREALKILAGEGIVIHHPGRGFFVAELSADEMRQLYTARRLLETELAKSIEWPTSEQTDHLRLSIEDIRDAARDRDVIRWAELHNAFHRDYFDLSPLKVLAGEAMRLRALTDRYRSLLAHQFLDEGAVNGLELLMDFLERRDREGLVSHFAKERGQLEDVLEEILLARGL